MRHLVDGIHCFGMGAIQFIVGRAQSRVRQKVGYKST